VLVIIIIAPRQRRCRCKARDELSSPAGPRCLSAADAAPSKADVSLLLLSRGGHTSSNRPRLSCTEAGCRLAAAQDLLHRRCAAPAAA